ncbi:MAG: pyridoxamine 5'-phosphate oxidase family protein [Bacteroidota bacterium]
MGKQFDSISKTHQEFIARQHLFFVATAAAEGSVNLSPKGMDSFRVIDQNKVVWLNLTGSGNETAAHLLKNDRMTIMFCAFEGNPLILRLYGKARIFHKRDAEFHEYIDLFPPNNGSRQVIEMDVKMVQTSCGFAVPLMDYRSDRDTLGKWAAKKDSEQIEEYWQQKNQKSIDGFDTNIFSN